MFHVVPSPPVRRLMSRVFDVLSDPHRLQLVELLRQGERPVGELVRATGMSQPSVSKHLKVLRDARVVVVRADAQRRLYRLQPSALEAIATWLEPYRVLWDQRLDDLEAELDRMD
jgi:DNA-binding transcriptional ArsR family regulator